MTESQWLAQLLGAQDPEQVSLQPPNGLCVAKPLRIAGVPLNSLSLTTMQSPRARQNYIHQHMGLRGVWRAGVGVGVWLKNLVGCGHISIKYTRLRAETA